MKKTFKEYHQFTKEEFQQLWKNCLFVLDTNTLLNMYRYSRETVTAYFDVLNELKKKKQLWIPYQVGYEFYKNRVNVISEYEKSYDEILLILEKAKSDIESKYRDHPFLNLREINENINKGLSGVEGKIKQAKNAHPKWLEKDEVLEKLNLLFEENVGNNYDEQKLDEIKEEGKERYENKIPPGFKDIKKNENEKYGDLILWYQIIDKAQKSKRPIILISGDVKEDWWLEKDGKRLMPLPQLKKELSDKAGVDFHIYTADRFLELNKTEEKNITNSTINEVRKIRELNERRVKMIRMAKKEREERERAPDSNVLEGLSLEYIHRFETLIEGIMMVKNESEYFRSHKGELDYYSDSLREMRRAIIHEGLSRITFNRFYIYTREISLILNKIIHSREIYSKLPTRYRDCINRLKDLYQIFQSHMQ
ncbi:MAG: PIN domain-containing protein [Candidatus Scalindua sp.]